MRISSTIGTLVIALLLANESSVANELTVERQAFERARDSSLAFTVTGKERDTEVVWAASLKTLALSKLSVADEYLAQLALFRLDGAVASEFSCAASKRSMRLANLLKAQEKQHATKNSCHQLAVASDIDPNRLCASRRELSALTRTLRVLPLKDEAGACSY